MQLIYSKSIIFLLLLFTALPLSSFAQEEDVKYANIFETVVSGADKSAYGMLMAFQKKNSVHANTYYQLALISEKWSKQYDPLTESEYVKLFIYNTKLYLGLAKLYIDDKEVRKNGEYYQQVRLEAGERKPTFEAVVEKVDSMMLVNKVFDENYNKIITYYTKSVEFYNQCVELFLQINAGDNKLKDILMTADNELIAKSNELKMKFDSTIYFFDEYKKAIKHYPIGEYNQTYTIKPIETYRLDGITSSNFLLPNVNIWDYGTWVNELHKILNSEIELIRKEVDKAEVDMNKAIATLQTTDIQNDTLCIYKIDEKLLNKIEKYDYQSIMSYYLTYKQQKIDFLTLGENSLNKPKVTSKEQLVRYARYYSDLHEKKHILDSLLLLVRNNITELKLAKYSTFFQKNFNNEAGFKTFMEKEEVANNKEMDAFLENYRKNILNNLNASYLKDSVVVYRNIDIPLTKGSSLAETAPNNSFVVTSVAETGTARYYITGFNKTSGTEINSFVASINNNAVEWLKTVSPTSGYKIDYQNIVAYDEGCFVIIHETNGTSSKNHVYEYNFSGRQLQTFDIEQNSMPRYFSYDDVNEKLIFVMKGIERNDNISVNENVQMLYCERNGTKIWNTDFQLKGSFVDVLKMDQNFVVVCNFSQVTLLNGQTLRPVAGTAENQTNVCSILFNLNGEFVNSQIYNYERPAFAFKAIKVNSNLINIVGVQSNHLNFQTYPLNFSQKLMYMLIDNSGKLIFKN